jgi:predicted anti-sigma-YlaC factor YlaD
MMSCDQSTRLASDSLERSLTFRERLALRVHVTMCSGCRNFMNQIHMIRNLAKAYVVGGDERAERDSKR